LEGLLEIVSLEMTTKGVGVGTYTFEELEGVRARRAGRWRGAGVKE